MQIMRMQEFKNEIEYQDYLKRQFDEISKCGDFNVFLHCVTSHTSYYGSMLKDREKDIEKKVSGILKNGLDLDGSSSYGRYGSINCTARFAGSINDLEDLNKITRYDYLSCSRFVHTIILLIPKYIKVGDELMEFSSLNGNIEQKFQHNKACLFDTVKETYCPREFIFGYQVFDTTSQEFKFYKNEKHFAHLEEDKQNDLQKYFENKIIAVKNRCKAIYNVEGIKDILAKLTQEHLKDIEDYLIDP